MSSIFFTVVTYAGRVPVGTELRNVPPEGWLASRVATPGVVVTCTVVFTLVVVRVKNIVRLAQAPVALLFMVIEVPLMLLMTEPLAIFVQAVEVMASPTASPVELATVNALLLFAQVPVVDLVVVIYDVTTSVVVTVVVVMTFWAV